MNFYLRNKLYIENATEEVREWCKTTLSFLNPDYLKKEASGKWTGNTPKEIVLYEKKGKGLILPFGCFSDIYKNFKYDASHCESKIAPIRTRNYRSNIQTYDYQELAVKSVLRAKNGILVAPCGSGKTQMGLEIVSRIGGKCLWLTHTLDLLQQSMDRAKANFGLSVSEYGTITGGKINVGNTITFATVQTMSSIDLTEYRDEWDCIIVDECHKCVGTPTNVMMFYKVLSNLSARYKIGLTATPYRADGLEKAMFALLGNIAHTVPEEAVEEKTCNVKVAMIETGFTPDMNVILAGDGTIVYSSLVENITKDMKRNWKIVETIQLAEKPILVLSDRIDHLKTLQEMSKNKDGIKSTAMLTGAMTSKTQKELRKTYIKNLNNGDIDVLFASYKLAKEGLDIPNLRTVVFATPQKDKATVIQSAGRVGRKAENKEFGTVIDFVDNFGMLKGYAQKRKGFYKTLKYNVKTIDIY